MHIVIIFHAMSFFPGLDILVISYFSGVIYQALYICALFINVIENI